TPHCAPATGRAALAGARSGGRCAARGLRERGRRRSGRRRGCGSSLRSVCRATPGGDRARRLGRRSRRQDRKSRPYANAVPPLVTVLLAGHDDAGFLTEAVDSVLGQSLRDLELIVIDDASNEQTQATLAGIGDARVTTIRNPEQQGLAKS